ncbi:MAG TPA: futalosine hydrolase [Bacteroidales bacterium]|mgnify:CR=1 FL=1|jgi:futalosine hydrolase|nr:futalosine hydrolase [Bacteroidales bacterium]HNR43043.1 futalosine hydrolase [Bacteroidales bacterium]HQG77942.1 futalosine hydrolase [Bacteroidales bacterium]
MYINILFVTATMAEAEVLRKIAVKNESGERFLLGNCIFDLLVTGVGCAATVWAISRWLFHNRRPDLVINSGIAGSFRDDIYLGQVVLPVSDCFADFGVETGTGFLTLAEAGLEDPDGPPFSGGRLIAGNSFIDMSARRLRTVNAISVSTATGSTETRQRLVEKYDPDIETMEGAAFFYACRSADVPFMAFRSVSNMVEPRDKSRWNIRLALDNLATELQQFILKIEKDETENRIFSMPQ